MKSTFSVIYYLKRQVVKKDGTVPVIVHYLTIKVAEIESERI